MSIPKKKSRSSTRVSAPSAAPPSLTPLQDATLIQLEEIDRWRTHYPPLSELDRDTFAEKYPDSYCESLAGSTKARGTLKDSRAWLRKLHPVATRRPVGDVGVPAVTMALFIEHTRELALAVESMNKGLGSDAAVKVEAARARANTRYRDVKARVEEALGANETWKAQLRAHLDSEQHSEQDADAARLLRLRDAINVWLGGKDIKIKHSLGIQGVKAETAAACGEAAVALEAARVHASGVAASDKDTPQVNRTEGHVLVLMREVFRAVNNAREAGTTELVLQPGAATRRVITPNANARKARSEIALSETTPGATETAGAPVNIRMAAPKRKKKRAKR